MDSVNTPQDAAHALQAQEKEQEKARSKRKEPSRGMFGFISSQWAEIGGVGVTLTSGALAAWNTIRYNFYRNVSRYGVFDDIRQHRDEEFTRIYRELKGAKNSEALIEAINKAENTYTHEVTKRLEGYGINNSIDRWKTLKSHQKTEVVLAFAGVTAVLMGVVASLSATRRVGESQEALRQDFEINQKQEKLRHDVKQLSPDEQTPLQPAQAEAIAALAERMNAAESSQQL